MKPMMRAGMMKILLNKGRQPLALLYLLFAIFPHFAAITHSHVGGELAHTHVFLSAHDDNLNRNLLENLGDVSRLKSVSMSASQEAVAPRAIALERGTQGLHSTVLRHTHFQEDPNLLALGVSIAILLMLMALNSAPLFRLPSLPSLQALRPVARGPPSFSFSV